MTQMQVQLNAEQLQQLELQAKSQGLSPQEHLDQVIACALEPRERRLKRATQHVLAKNKELYERLRVAAISNEMTNLAQLQQASRQFWRSRDIAQLVKEQRVAPVTSLEQLRSQAWPGDEAVEDFQQFIGDSRRASLEQENQCHDP